MKDQKSNPIFSQTVLEEFKIYNDWILLEPTLAKEFFGVLFIVARIKNIPENETISFISSFYQIYQQHNPNNSLFPFDFQDSLVEFKNSNLPEILCNLFLNIKIQPTKAKKLENTVLPKTQKESRERKQFLEIATEKIPQKKQEKVISKTDSSLESQKFADWINSERGRLGIF